MYYPFFLFADRALLIDRIPQNIHNASQSFFSYRNLDSLSSISNPSSARQSVGGAHGNAAYQAAANLLLNLKYQLLFTFNFKCVIYLRHLVIREFHIHYSTDDLNHHTLCGFLIVSHVYLLKINVIYTAAAPETISVIS